MSGESADAANLRAARVLVAARAALDQHMDRVTAARDEVAHIEKDFMPLHAARQRAEDESNAALSAIAAGAV